MFWIRTILMFLMQCLMSPAMGSSAVCDLPRCHWSGLAFGHVRNLALPLHPAFRGSNYLLFLDFLWSGILVFVFSFGAWWEIHSIQKAARSAQRRIPHDDQSQLRSAVRTDPVRTVNAKKKDPLNKFKMRVLNIAMQTSACLLLSMVR
jgi:hypothetical protein